MPSTSNTRLASDAQKIDTRSYECRFHAFVELASLRSTTHTADLCKVQGTSAVGIEVRMLYDSLKRVEITRLRGDFDRMHLEKIESVNVVNLIIPPVGFVKRNKFVLIRFHLLHLLLQINWREASLTGMTSRKD